MDIVNNFMGSVNWYQPTTDADDWQYFANVVQSLNYANATPATLKVAAWQMIQMAPGEDVGMWQQLQGNFTKFLEGCISLDGSNQAAYVAIQYEFVACFLNTYSNAAHNQDLWKSFNNCASTALQPAQGRLLSIAESGHIQDQVLPAIAQWALASIPAILYGGFQSVDLTYYRPTEDTDTWDYFFNFVYQFDFLENYQVIFRIAFRLCTISSGPDAGVWGEFQQAIVNFLNSNLQLEPTQPQAQLQLAINFANTLIFDYNHAAHNASLFQSFATSFSNVVQLLQQNLQQLDNSPEALRQAIHPI